MIFKIASALLLFFIVFVSRAEICSIDLHNQEQVVERLALLKLRVQGASEDKSEQDFYNFIYEGQLKLFAEKFGKQEEGFDLLVEEQLRLRQQQIKN